MIHIFFNLQFELFYRVKWSIIADYIHDIYTERFAVYVTIKSENMHFKVSFFALIGTRSEKDFTIERNTTGKSFLWDNTTSENDVCCRETY